MLPHPGRLLVIDEVLELDRCANVTFLESGFIRLYVLPRLPNTEHEFLLLLLHIVSAQVADPVVHVLNGFVVHVSEHMDRGKRDAEEEQ